MDHHFSIEANKRNLKAAMILIGSWMVIQFFGALWTGSLALLADAFHMVNDFANLLLSLVAIVLAGRAATWTRTFGSQRYEILAALVNSAALLVIAVLVMREALLRLASPEEVMGGTMMIFAFIGLLINLGAMYVLMRGDVKHSLNMRGAYLHVLSDTLGSVAAVTGGLIIYLTGWYTADPLLSVLIALLIGWTGFRLLQESVHVLLEGTPPHIDLQEVEQQLLAIEGVINVHAIHAWTINSGSDSFTAHLVLEAAHRRSRDEVRMEAEHYLRETMRFTHCTIQLEEEGATCAASPI
ncbi:cation diffusion facilitator family transporter [Alkalicoccus chagannorensis]|uniref:cation diffusion facilitator family transporter n=1 Tax=Alkalicoccus chagannorensis TaxID=427072 RepID=UPI00040F0EE9|nr:cation diffusion facilitator family transporter [Alkalicoccus chagannorensis]